MSEAERSSLGDAFASFYGIHLAAAPAAKEEEEEDDIEQEGLQEPASPLDEDDINEIIKPKENKGAAGANAQRKPSKLDIESHHFVADEYVERLLQTHSMSELLEQSNSIGDVQRRLNADMQSLVYENYDRFIAATDVILRMRGNIDAMDAEMKRLEASVASIQQTSAKLERAFEPNRTRVAELARLVSLLNRLDFLFRLPGYLESCVTHGLFRHAVTSFVAAAALLKQYAHIPSLTKILSAAQMQIERLRVRLKAAAQDASTKPETQIEYVFLLVQLGESAKTLLKDTLSSRAAAFKLNLRKCVLKYETALAEEQQERLLGSDFVMQRRRLALKQQQIQQQGNGQRETASDDDGIDDEDDLHLDEESIPLTTRNRAASSVSMYDSRFWQLTDAAFLQPTRNYLAQLDQSFRRPLEELLTRLQNSTGKAFERGKALAEQLRNSVVEYEAAVQRFVGDVFHPYLLEAQKELTRTAAVHLRSVAALLRADLEDAGIDFDAANSAAHRYREEREAEERAAKAQRQKQYDGKKAEQKTQAITGASGEVDLLELTQPQIAAAAAAAASRAATVAGASWSAALRATELELSKLPNGHRLRYVPPAVVLALRVLPRPRTGVLQQLRSIPASDVEQRIKAVMSSSVAEFVHDVRDQFKKRLLDIHALFPAADLVTALEIPCHLATEACLKASLNLTAWGMKAILRNAYAGLARLSLLRRQLGVSAQCLNLSPARLEFVDNFYESETTVAPYQSVIHPSSSLTTLRTPSAAVAAAQPPNLALGTGDLTGLSSSPAGSVASSSISSNASVVSSLGSSATSGVEAGSLEFGSSLATPFEKRLEGTSEEDTQVDHAKNAQGVVLSSTAKRYLTPFEQDFVPPRPLAGAVASKLRSLLLSSLMLLPPLLEEITRADTAKGTHGSKPTGRTPLPSSRHQSVAVEYVGNVQVTPTAKKGLEELRNRLEALYAALVGSGGTQPGFPALSNELPASLSLNVNYEVLATHFYDECMAMARALAASTTSVVSSSITAATLADATAAAMSTAQHSSPRAASSTNGSGPERDLEESATISAASRSQLAGFALDLLAERYALILAKARSERAGESDSAGQQGQLLKATFELGLGLGLGLAFDFYRAFESDAKAAEESHPLLLFTSSLKQSEFSPVYVSQPSFAIFASQVLYAFQTKELERVVESAKQLFMLPSALFDSSLASPPSGLTSMPIAKQAAFLRSVPRIIEQLRFGATAVMQCFVQAICHRCATAFRQDFVAGVRMFGRGAKLPPSLFNCPKRLGALFPRSGSVAMQHVISELILMNAEMNDVFAPVPLRAGKSKQATPAPSTSTTPHTDLYSNIVPQNIFVGEGGIVLQRLMAGDEENTVAFKKGSSDGNSATVGGRLGRSSESSLIRELTMDMHRVLIRRVSAYFNNIRIVDRGLLAAYAVRAVLAMLIQEYASSRLDRYDVRQLQLDVYLLRRCIAAVLPHIPLTSGYPISTTSGPSQSHVHGTSSASNQSGIHNPSVLSLSGGIGGTPMLSDEMRTVTDEILTLLEDLSQCAAIRYCPAVDEAWISYVRTVHGDRPEAVLPEGLVPVSLASFESQVPVNEKLSAMRPFTSQEQKMYSSLDYSEAAVTSKQESAALDLAAGSALLGGHLRRSSLNLGLGLGLGSTTSSGLLWPESRLAELYTAACTTAVTNASQHFAKFKPHQTNPISHEKEASELEDTTSHGPELNSPEGNNNSDNDMP